MPIELKEKVVLLCEGKADHNFFLSMVEKRSGIPKFDIPNPKEFYSRDGFKRTLEALRGSGQLSNIEGVLIMADSHDAPAETFRHICNQIKDAGGYPVPSKLLEVAPATRDHPAIAVMLLPDETTPGGLESLCVQEILERFPWAAICVEQFLKCDKIEAHSWPPEKLDKAKYHCLIAALNRDDPSKAVSNAFAGSSPLVDVTARCFDSVEKRIKDFCTVIGA